MITLLASFLLAPAAAPLTPGKVIDLKSSGGFDYMTVDGPLRRVFATHGGAKTLVVLDLKTGKAEELAVGQVNGVQVNEALDRVFTAGGGQHLVALERKTLKKVGDVQFDGPCDDIVVDTKRALIYVCHDDGTEDWVVDARTLAKRGKIDLVGIPEYIEYDRRTDRLYQNIKDKNSVQVFSAATRKPIGAWPTPPMESPHGLAIDSMMERVFTAGRNGKLEMFAMATGKCLATVDIAPGTDQIAYDPVKRRVYCTGRGALSVVGASANALTPLGQVSAPNGVHTLAVDPITHDVWVCYGNAQGAHLMQFRVGR